MVKTLFLGLLAATICGFVYAAPKLPHHQHHPEQNSTSVSNSAAQPLEDPAARSERSTNLSHVTGTARKIQMFIKNRHLQILPDGTVNGTTDDNSPYTILQRTTVGIGQMKIQGVATCQYLCMASCGLLYGSREFGDECVFNETIEQSNYNTYSSSKYSNDKRTFYLALNRRGQSRKVVVRARHQLGKLSSYTRVLTRNVAPEMQLPAMRHHNHACSNTVTHQVQKPHPSHQRCPKRKKRKKKKRKCLGDENDPEVCQKRQVNNNNSNTTSQAQNRNNNVKCEDDKDSDVCQRDVQQNNSSNNNKRRQLTNSDKTLVSDPRKKKKVKKALKKKLDQINQETTTTMLPPTSTTPPEEMLLDEDYGLDSSTHSDWEDSTSLPEINMAVSEAKQTPLQSESD